VTAPPLEQKTVSTTVWYTKHPLLKSAYKAQKKWRRRLRDSLEHAYYRYHLRRNYARSRRLFAGADASFDKYLRAQLEETLLKRRLFGRVRADVIPLVDMLASKHDLTGASVLCVGCRNDDEIRYFRKRGAGRVMGIDLYNAGAGILIMDMHDLKFPDSAFDVVYSRHSFEHSYDTRKAAAEFTRVLKPGGVVVIEVPGRHQGGGDYNYFTSIDDVTAAFEGRIGEYLWREYSRKEDNTDKLDIIRVIFKVRK
jgi:SAM-dependent methyltransferase